MNKKILLVFFSLIGFLLFLSACTQQPVCGDKVCQISEDQKTINGQENPAYCPTDCPTTQGPGQQGGGLEGGTTGTTTECKLEFVKDYDTGDNAYDTEGPEAWIKIGDYVYTQAGEQASMAFVSTDISDITNPKPGRTWQWTNGYGHAAPFYGFHNVLLDSKNNAIDKYVALSSMMSFPSVFDVASDPKAQNCAGSLYAAHGNSRVTTIVIGNQRYAVFPTESGIKYAKANFTDLVAADSKANGLCFKGLTTGQEPKENNVTIDATIDKPIDSRLISFVYNNKVYVMAILHYAASSKVFLLDFTNFSETNPKAKLVFTKEVPTALSLEPIVFYDGKIYVAGQKISVLDLSGNIIKQKDLPSDVKADVIYINADDKYLYLALTSEPKHAFMILDKETLETVYDIGNDTTKNAAEIGDLKVFKPLVVTQGNNRYVVEMAKFKIYKFSCS